MKLSDSKIRGLSPSAKTYRVSDGGGLVIRVTPKGRKIWEFRYRFATKEKSLSLGGYPSRSLREAREQRMECERLLLDGVDPSAARRKEKLLSVYHNRDSFIQVAEEWRDKKQSGWTESHGIKTWGRLKNHVFPYLGSRPVTEIEPLDILAVIQRIEGNGLTEMSRRVLQLCSSIFRYAKITGRVLHNPAEGLNDALRSHRVTHYPIIEVSELPRFLTKLRSVDCSEQCRLAFEILLHTALRTGELRQAQWKDLNWEKRKWVLPAETTKARRVLEVPLSDYTLELLRKLENITGHQKWMFPNQQVKKHPIMSNATILKVIERMGYGGQMVGHGVRSLFSSILNEAGFNPDAIERQLAHQERSAVRAAYNRAQYWEERKTMMVWWSDFLIEQEASDSRGAICESRKARRPNLILVTSPN